VLGRLVQALPVQLVLLALLRLAQLLARAPPGLLLPVRLALRVLLPALEPPSLARLAFPLRARPAFLALASQLLARVRPVLLASPGLLLPGPPEPGLVPSVLLLLVLRASLALPPLRWPVPLLRALPELRVSLLVW